MKEKVKEYTIDLDKKILGRAASEVAKLLRGKELPSYVPYRAAAVVVKAINVDKLKISPKKLKTEFLKRYSGYPGGLKIISLEKAFKKDPARIFKKAVERMLPRNKLRKKILKNLFIS